jgi:Tfp pilus assembly protein PilF
MNKPSLFDFPPITRSFLTYCCALTLFGIVVFANHLHNALQFDSVLYIKNGVNIQSPEEILNWKFISKEYCCRSLTRITLSINAFLDNANPFGYHLFNLAIHTLNSILVFFVVIKAFRYFCPRLDCQNKSTTNLAGFLASVGFLCHPIQTESVVYIVSRSGLIAATIYLSTFLLFQKFLAGKYSKSLFAWIGIGVISATLISIGYGFKQNVITFPATAILYWYCRLPENSQPLQILKKLKWFILGIAFSALTVLMWKLISDEGFLIGPSTAGEAVGRVNYMLSQPIVIVFYYFKLFFWPFNLNIDPDIPFGTLSPQLLLSIALIFGPLWALFNKKSLLIYFFGLSWFYIVISPSSSIITLLDIAAEHRIYLGTVGLFLIFGVLGARFAQALKINTNHTKKMALLIACIVMLCLTTIKRNSIWKTEEALWMDTQKKSPNKTRAWINLGRAKTLSGNIKRAIYYYENAIKLNPDFFQTQFNLGSLYHQQGKYREALEHFFRARILAPNLSEPFGRIGETYMALKDYPEANKFLKKAVEINPNYSIAFRNLGVTNYYYLNKKREGLVYFKKSLSLDPNQPGVDQVIRLLKLEGVL